MNQSPPYNQSSQSQGIAQRKYLSEPGNWQIWKYLKIPVQFLQSVTYFCNLLFLGYLVYSIYLDIYILISSLINFVYKLSLQLLEDLPLRVLGNSGMKRKYQNWVEVYRVSSRKNNFGQWLSKLMQKQISKISKLVLSNFARFFQFWPYFLSCSLEKLYLKVPAQKGAT